VRQLLAGSITLEEFVDRSFELTGDFMVDAFEAGMLDGAGAEEEIAMTDEEAGFVFSQAALIQQRLLEFGQTIIDGQYDGKLRQALARADLYSGPIEWMWWQGLAYGAADQMHGWILGGTKEHCRDCLAYHGQRHRMSDWRAVGAIPNSWNLECKGIHCECELRPSRGAEVGQLQPPGAN
jgi:hypothetical protein